MQVIRWLTFAVTALIASGLAGPAQRSAAEGLPVLPDPAFVLLTAADLPGFERISFWHEEIENAALQIRADSAEAGFRGPASGVHSPQNVRVSAWQYVSEAQAQERFRIQVGAPPGATAIPLPAGLGDQAAAWRAPYGPTDTIVYLWIRQGSVFLHLNETDDQGGWSDTVVADRSMAVARRARAAGRPATGFDWDAPLPTVPRPWSVGLTSSDMGPEWSLEFSSNAAEQGPAQPVTVVGDLQLHRADGAKLRSWVQGYESIEAAAKWGEHGQFLRAFPVQPMGDEVTGVTSSRVADGRQWRDWEVVVRRGAVIMKVILDVPANEPDAEGTVVDAAQRILARLDTQLPPAAAMPLPDTDRQPLWEGYGYRIPAGAEFAPVFELIHQQGFDWVLATLSRSPTPVSFDATLGLVGGYDSLHGVRLGPSAQMTTVEAQATLLVHETTHVRDELAGIKGGSPETCYLIELRAVANQVAFWRSLWGAAGKSDPTDAVELFENQNLAAFADIPTGQEQVRERYSATCKLA